MTAIRTTRKFTTIAAGVLTALVFSSGALASAAPVTDDPGVVAEINATLQGVAAEFPKFQNVKFYTDYLAPGEYAETTMYTITFNRRYTSDPQAWHDAFAADVVNGFHEACSSAPRYTALHEAGHILSLRTGRRAEAIVLKRVADGTLSGSVSQYAVTNADEAVSESFAAVKCGTATPTEHEIYNILVSTQ